MPDVADYDDQDDWMAACVPERIEEGDEQDQAVAVCLSMWRERESKTMTVDNTLKALAWNDDEFRVGNYIVLFDVRDLEGVKPGTTEVAWKNPDGSRGEYFTKSTDLESTYTATGRVLLDYEHGLGKEMDGEDAPGRDDVLGFVDWSTKHVDDRGVWVERALNRHNAYMQWLEQLIKAGVVGTSSEAIPDAVQKAADGAILKWPLRRDTLTITPMEWRNKGENVVQALKALGLVSDDTFTLSDSNGDTFTTENVTGYPDLNGTVELVQIAGDPEPEATPEAGKAVDAVKARLRVKLQLLKRRNNNGA